ncbi:MAG: iron ABC transporter permease [Planctomycetes bacterium]|nr:iron ABC transporter permease [Planctomycetota bacterium]
MEIPVSRLLIIGLLLILLIGVVIICLGIGSTGISYNFLFGALGSPVESTIIWQVRLPRILASLLVGVGLAVAGSVLQAILRNPLAEPYTLGISGGAALGVTLALIAAPLAVLNFTLPVAAFIGAIGSMLLVYLVASRQHFTVSSLILSGVILSFICSSLVLLIFAVAKPTEVQSVLYFLMGNFSTVDYSLLKVIVLPLALSVGVLIVLGRDIDALSLGDEKAMHLGVSARSMRRLIFVITSVITGCCVAVCGMVGFVGLMIPHIMRALVGPKQQFLIISSALSGAVFLIISDTLARTVIAPTELPVGVITGLVGGLFFIGVIANAKNI